MKPLTTASDATMMTSPPAPPKLSVVDQLRAVDTSVLDRLVAIRQEEAQLEQYRSRAEQMKGNVSELVYRRVAEDYARRVSVLEQQAAPLRVQARTEYRKLRQMVEHISAAFEQAKTEKEECEFRHAVGELDDDHLGERLQGPQRVLDECQADMSCIDEHKARFIEAMGSEAALEAPAKPETRDQPPTAPAASGGTAPPPARAVQPPPEAPTMAVPKVTAPLEPPTMAVPKVSPPPPPPPAAPKEPPAAMTPEETQFISAVEASAAMTPPFSDQDEGQTLLVPLAALIAEPGALPKSEYRLGALNYIGRGDENQVQIIKPGISRKHAVITAAGGGFSLKDLGSQNGVTINGERVTERTLADGDRVEIAGVVLVFRSPWPVVAKAASGSAAVKGSKSDARDASRSTSR